MNHTRIFGLVVLVLGLATLGLRAQIPGVPSAPAVPAAPGIPGAGSIPGAPAAPAVPGAPTTAAAPKGNLFDMLCPTDDQIKKCKDKICNCPLGQMLNSMIMPITAFSGGLIPPLCPPDQPNPADLGLDADSALGAAAKIKADEAGAKARRAAMRYLGTVDCHYFPEAEGALIGGLRADKNECVRWEAALSLGKGCCCTKKTIEALNITVSGSEKDGHPYETSPRVIAAAFTALNHCLSCYQERPATKPKEKAAPIAISRDVEILMPEYYVKQLSSEPMEKIVASARLTLAHYNEDIIKRAPLATGDRSITQIMAKAGTPPPPPPAPVAIAVPAKPATGNTVSTSPTAHTAKNRDLYHMFKNAMAGSSPQPEPPLAVSNASATDNVRTTNPSPPAATAPPVGTKPATGNRDLFHILSNSIGSN